MWANCHSGKDDNVKGIDQMMLEALGFGIRLL